MEQELKGKLVGLGLTEEQIGKLEGEGVMSGADIGKLTAAEIKETTGCGLVTAKKVEEAFAPVKETVEAVIVRAGEAAVVEALPPLPEGDKSFVDMMKVPSVLKVAPVDVLAAVRASIASNVKLDKVPETILEKIEAFAETQGEPVKEIFYKIMKLVAARSYAEILSAVGVSGHFMSDKRKRAFLDKLGRDFWKALSNFQGQLEAWWDLWTGGLQSAGVALLAFKDDKAKGGDDLFSDLTETPDAGTLRAAAEAVIGRINQVFAGAGIPVARALAYDATKTRELLGQEGLPEAMGCTTKEQMLKVIGQELGTSVEADYVEFEKNVALFILGIMNFSNVTGEKERKYIIGMRRLGKLINWDKLGIRESGGPTSGSGSFRGGRG